MSQLKNLIILSIAWAIIAFLYSRTSRKTEKPQNKKTDEFIARLKSGDINTGSYGLSIEAPSLFTKNDIPGLLEYIDNIQEIPFFPANPVSSYKPQKYYLGETLMWMIESARSEKLYPSLNGKLYNKETGQELEMYEFGKVAELFRQWWEKAQTDDLVYKTNPLTDSPYAWYGEE